MRHYQLCYHDNCNCTQAKSCTLDVRVTVTGVQLTMLLYLVLLVQPVAVCTHNAESATTGSFIMYRVRLILLIHVCIQFTQHCVHAYK
jgi:hypothetical protein